MKYRSQIVVGDVRIQMLSNSLLRIERRGPKGFEDRCTFCVVNRDWPGADYEMVEDDGTVILKTASYQVILPCDGDSLEGLSVVSLKEELIFEYDGKAPDPSDLPDPGDPILSWIMSENPRIVPPEWGALPPPDKYSHSSTSGWDIDKDGIDLYVFIPGGGGYRQLRADFLRLTGPIPIPSLFMFGLIDSRYHPYSDESALQHIDTYREKGIPLDVFVMDTDWREGASHGYEINSDLFPDMEEFLLKAHELDVYVMFNDHPEPYTEGALSPEELHYRYDSLTSLLAKGADVWWYDRNWMTHLEAPVPGFVRDVWGQKLYHDITQHFRPERRPLIMSNVAGIEHGFRVFPAHYAEHRYPVWWTGDTAARWDYLRRGVENSVGYGINGLMPYVHEDLGGHWGNPDPELYVRFVQFGLFSPITRLHCTRDESRYPWAFGEEAERIVSDYIRLRYRLLPTIYAAARIAYDDGTPILRRCDLEWPMHSEARDNNQYMFGDDILVAPMTTGGSDLSRIDAAYMTDESGALGLKGEYYGDLTLSGKSVSTRVDQYVDFDWGWDRSPQGITSGEFSVRWIGRLVDVPETGTYDIGVFLSGKAKMLINGEPLLVIEEGNIIIPHTTEVHLQRGESYDLEIEYSKTEQRAAISLVWRPPSIPGALPGRSLWLPPGRWMDLWSGVRLKGLQRINVSSGLRHTPLYQREGGMVFTLPQMQYTGQSPWETVINHVVLPEGDMTITRTLYEDDGISPEYLDGKFCKTPVTLGRNGDQVALRIASIMGDYPGRLKRRNWIIQLHLPSSEIQGEVLLDGKLLPYAGEDAVISEPALMVIPSADLAEYMPYMGVGARPGPEGAAVVEISLPEMRTDEPFELEIYLIAE